MQKSSLYRATGLLSLLITGLFGCSKINGINNNTVIETPFSLYFSDTAGALYNSNDGITVNKPITFQPDGFPCRAICTVNDNLLWVKSGLLISSNNGVNFNHSFDSVNSLPGIACNGYHFDLNQSMIISVPDLGKVYIASNSIDIANYVGLYSSYQEAFAGTWLPERSDTSVAGQPPNFGTYPVRITTMTYMPSISLLAGYDPTLNRNFYLTKGLFWRESTGDASGSPYNISGTPLPDSGHYYLGHINSRLIAISPMGNCTVTPALYSDDTGRNWKPYSGLPSNPLLCIASPFEEVCLIGTDSAGLYILNQNTGTTWQQETNNGLGTNLVVRSIAYKQNIYKNGTIKKYVFLATNQGIYMSTDLGNNWTLTIPGNYVAIY